MKLFEQLIYKHVILLTAWFFLLSIHLFVFATGGILETVPNFVPILFNPWFAVPIVGIYFILLFPIALLNLSFNLFFTLDFLELLYHNTYAEHLGIGIYFLGISYAFERMIKTKNL